MPNTQLLFVCQEQCDKSKMRLESCRAHDKAAMLRWVRMQTISQGGGDAAFKAAKEEASDKAALIASQNTSSGAAGGGFCLQ